MPRAARPGDCCECTSSDKVEILAYATPEQAPAIHTEILERASAAIAELGLAYRIVDICTGDLGQAHHRSWDVEVYAPGADQWLEVSSVSWYSDYQARRANLRYRPTGEKGHPHPPHPSTAQPWPSPEYGPP